MKIIIDLIIIKIKEYLFLIKNIILSSTCRHVCR